MTDSFKPCSLDELKNFMHAFRREHLQFKIIKFDALFDFTLNRKCIHKHIHIYISVSLSPACLPFYGFLSRQIQRKRDFNTYTLAGWLADRRIDRCLCIRRCKYQNTNKQTNPERNQMRFYENTKILFEMPRNRNNKIS